MQPWQEKIEAAVQSILSAHLSVDVGEGDILGCGPASYAIVDLLKKTSSVPEWTPDTAIAQIKSCKFMCEGGALENNVAWQWIKENIV